MPRPYDRRAWRNAKPYGQRCYLCGAAATEYDHRVPIAEGGAWFGSNLAPACRPCNRRRGGELRSRMAMAKGLGSQSRRW